MSNSMDIEWHEHCLQNLRRTLSEESRHLAAQHEAVNRLANDVAHYERQIEDAKARGMLKFDRDRLHARRKLPTA